MQNPPLSVPRHVAIIMDGNGRWAQSRGLERIEGHSAGSRSVRAVVEECGRLGIRYLTLFSFSTENWGRPAAEVDALMRLFQLHLDSELPELKKNGVRLRAVGDLERLPPNIRASLQRDIDETAENTGLDLILAISYGAREEIVHATRKLAAQVARRELAAEEITEEHFREALWTGDIPDPDLLIRSSGEMRLSNFLLWQVAYAEIVVAPELWPDFNGEVFRRCLDEYSGRKRRFGLTGEQIGARERAVV